MKIVTGSVFHLPSGNVVQVVEVIHHQRLTCRYLQAQWHNTGRGVSLTVQWLQRYGRQA